LVQAIERKKARAKQMEAEIKEQEMTLLHKKSKLWRTQVVTLLLVLITVLQCVNFQQIQQDHREERIHHQKLVDMTKKAYYFAGLEKRLDAENYEIRLQALVDALREHLIKDKARTRMFDIDKYRD
jgi:hypothetical protein